MMHGAINVKYLKLVYRSQNFRILMLYNSDGNLLSVVKSCRITSNGVHTGLVNLKKKEESATDSGVKPEAVENESNSEGRNEISC